MPLYNPVSSSTQLSSDYDLLNLGLSTSVAANAMTITLQTQAGGNPGVGDPVKIGFRSSTITSGGYNQRSVTSALSITIPSGATLGHASGVQHDIWVYAIDNAGTVELAVAQCLYSERDLVTSTTISGSATSNRVLYSTAGRSNVPIRLLGKVISNQITAGTYASNATAVYTGTYASLTAGRVVGILYTNSAGTAIPTTTGTAPFATKVHDFNNSFSSNTFTCTEDGLYKVKLNLGTQSQAWGANTYFYAGIAVNGTTVTKTLGQTNVNTAITTSIQINGACDLILLSGDTVVVRWISSDSGHNLIAGATDNYLSIFKEN